ncbi:MAG TPA: hypothetical protein VGU03_03370 [Frateuria sp.]|uniref:hypothetical protein n=1 Tax=Frateuria sp. TaxID=2211372 RepID=UPI002DE2C70A|nr:hypothetical protein [Frateuria sp.]
MAQLEAYNITAKRYIERSSYETIVAASSSTREGNWQSVRGTDFCKICLSEPASFNSDVYVRLQLVGKFKATQGNFIALGETLSPGRTELRHIDLESTDAAPIYLESSVMGHHQLTKVANEMATLLIDNSFNGPINNYFTISSERSWKEVAWTYQKKQATLSRQNLALPIKKANNINQMISELATWVAANNLLSNSDTQTIFPVQRTDAILSGEKTDCKGAAALLQYALRIYGVPSHIVLLSSRGTLPRSFVVPNGDWADHAIIYIPSLDKYVDLTDSAMNGTPWNQSADKYRNFISLDTATGIFAVVH